MSRTAARDLLGGGGEVRARHVGTGRNGVELDVVLLENRPFGCFYATRPPHSRHAPIIVEAHNGVLSDRITMKHVLLPEPDHGGTDFLGRIAIRTGTRG